jgi:hypothetical protein
MPKIPTVKNLEANTAQILNAARADIGGAYAQDVPKALSDGTNLAAIGEIVMNNPAYPNQLYSSLANRIGMVLLTSKAYRSSLKMLKRGLMTFGEKVEEIFVAMAEPHDYNIVEAQTNVFKLETGDVYTSFHTLNYEKFYKKSISEENLRQAFLSPEGVYDLIGGLYESLYSGAEYDEFLTTKYLIAKMILDGYIGVTKIPAVTADTVKEVATTMAEASYMFRFPSNKYNIAKVTTFSRPEDLILMTSAKFGALNNFNVLASAFNMDKAEIEARHIMIDGFDIFDLDRLDKLLGNDPEYTRFTEDQLALLGSVPAVTFDKNWFMIFDVLMTYKEIYNPEGMYWQNIYHVWKIFSVSPFTNAMMYTDQASSVTSVAVSPKTATLSKGATLQMTATVATVGFADKSVIWTVSGKSETTSTISSTGLLYIAGDEANTELTVTATSALDSKKTDTATITIPA